MYVPIEITDDDCVGWPETQPETRPGPSTSFSRRAAHGRSAVAVPVLRRREDAQRKRQKGQEDARGSLRGIGIAVKKHDWEPGGVALFGVIERDAGPAAWTGNRANGANVYIIGTT